MTPLTPLTPVESMTYMIVCQLWRTWRAPALLSDIVRWEQSGKDAVKDKLKAIKKKGWIVTGKVRRAKGLGWVPTHQARAMERLDEIMRLVVNVAATGEVPGEILFDVDRVTNQREAQRLLEETGWIGSHPSDPTTS